MRYDDLIWDFDGTLFDTYPPMCRALRLAMERVGFAFTEEELMPWYTTSRKDVMAYCAQKAQISESEADAVYRGYLAEFGQPPARPFPGIPSFLRRFLQAGGRHFLFTHRSESVHQYLAEAGLTDLFAAVVSSGKTFARKPDPAGNLYLIATYGLTPRRTLAIGDRELDVLAGKRAGTDACLFTPERRESAADYQIDRFDRLYDITELAGS